MKTITIVFVLNAALLLLHEIESAYEKEWEILHLPGKITGFLILHVPIIIMLFYGALGIEKGTTIGHVIGLITGMGGLIPLIVHKVIVRRKGRFDRLISDVLIYSNVITGVAVIVLSVRG